MHLYLIRLDLLWQSGQFNSFILTVINVMLVVISSQLIEPPSDGLMVRFLAQTCKLNLHSDVLIESPIDMIDLNYHYMRSKGIFDYVDDIQPLFVKEDGIRLDVEPNFPKSVIVKAITFQNVRNILGQIKNLTKLT